MQAIFERKPDFCFRKFVVEDSITIPAKIFSDLLRHPLLDREFIAEHIPQMYTDKNDVRHCLLIMGEGRSDGLLVESQGYPERGVCLYRCGNERYLLQVIAPEYKAALFGKAGGR